MSLMSFDAALPVIFMALMGISMLVYVISDGYDLGVGMLMHRATDAEKDVMVASIGDRKSTRLNSSHIQKSRMPSSA